ncbi:DUF2782 domain-containing protein [Mariprofundus erugo]|nr:DUF2782 domain-containing protein [Mariprofundus erugo]
MNRLRMMILSPLLLLPLLALSSPVRAAEDVAPPPVVDTSAPAAITDQAVAAEKPASLKDELKAPDDTTAVDIRSYQGKDGVTVTEYASHGQVFKVKVQPAGGMPAYYLYREPNGQFVRRLPGGGTAIVPPSWILKEF